MTKAETLLLWLVLKRMDDDLQEEIVLCKKDQEHYVASFIVPEDAVHDEEVGILELEIHELEKKQGYIRDRILNLEGAMDLGIASAIIKEERDGKG